MFVLEYKQLHIVKTEQRKNQSHQSYRWKQYVMCEEREPLEKLIKDAQRPWNWRIVEQPGGN